MPHQELFESERSPTFYWYSASVVGQGIAVGNQTKSVLADDTCVIMTIQVSRMLFYLKLSAATLLSVTNTKIDSQPRLGFLRAP
jgi:hypothetical protein